MIYSGSSVLIVQDRHIDRPQLLACGLLEKISSKIFERDLYDVSAQIGNYLFRTSKMSNHPAWNDLVSILKLKSHRLIKNL